MFQYIFHMYVYIYTIIKSVFFVKLYAIYLYLTDKTINFIKSIHTTVTTFYTEHEIVRFPNSFCYRLVKNSPNQKSNTRFILYMLCI